MDFITSADVRNSIRRVDELLACGIFQPANQGHVLFRAAFIELLIALRDLMYKSEKSGYRVAFTDDVKRTEKIQDVTHLIKYVRDALCHPDSDNHYIDSGMKASFNVMFGQGCLLKAGDFEQSSRHADDICFFFGSQAIYLRRHLVRAFNEAKAHLLPLVER